ncbi:hypothetical protein MASR2M17_21320 [Aminivibrio sp.]
MGSISPWLGAVAGNADAGLEVARFATPGDEKRAVEFMENVDIDIFWEYKASAFA